MVVKIKHGSERSQIFHFNSREVKQRSECSQRINFDSSEVRQRSQRSQRFIFQSLMPRKLFFSGLYYNSNSEGNVIS